MNRITAYVFVLGLLGMGVGAIASCSMADLIHVRTPVGVQQAKGLPAKLSLAEAQPQYEMWLAEVQTQGAQWRDNIERGNEIRVLIGQLTMSALDSVGPVIAGVPVLGPALPVLAGLAGLFVGRSPLRKEKEASFNKGLEEGLHGRNPGR